MNVIKVENLSKKYTIRHQQRESYTALRDVMAHGAKRLGAKLLSPFTFHPSRSALSPPPSALIPSREDFWALKDVSFEVKQGEVVGIIGRNGAGKSTLLKILSRITEPTTGSVKIKGSIASLLEVGTGFHPELTGRENVYLNGAILGMTKAEIKKKFDEIVAFAEIEKFLDTPVKRYSSGMYVRLAFAVAAHLDPEILIIDEVLAVGDAAFQKKCLGKMGSVAKEGRTVIFVSHNMGAINQLCQTAVFLETGKLREFDESSKVVKHYLNSNSNIATSIELTKNIFRRGTREVMFEWAQICNSAGEPCREFSIGEDIRFDFRFKVNEKYVNKKIKLAVELRSSDGTHLCNMIDVDSEFQIENAKVIEKISVLINDIRFYPDTYYVSFWVGSITSIDTLDYVEDCLSFEIVDGGKLTTRKLPRSAGLFFLTPQWKRAGSLTE